MGHARTRAIDGMPELVRLAEEVRATGEPLLLRRGGEDVAVLSPPGTRLEHGPGRVKTEEDRRAFLATAGSWRDVDVDRFLEDNAASRSLRTRPPVAL